MLIKSTMLKICTEDILHLYSRALSVVHRRCWRRLCPPLLVLGLDIETSYWVSIHLYAPSINAHQTSSDSDFTFLNASYFGTFL